jgi:hypothetical protein
MSKRSTNIEIATEVAKASSMIADALGYDSNTGKLGVDLNTFSETLAPEIANEFLAVLSNKIVVQRVYDPLAGWNNPYEVFRREMSMMGDAEELLSVGEVADANYSTTSSLTSTSTPDVKVAFIQTTHKKVWTTSVSMELLRGAFVQEFGLSSLVSLIIKKLRDSKELYLYDTIVEELKTGITIEAVITEIIGVGEAEASRDAYEEILTLVHKFTIPTADYNESGLRAITPKGQAILILNASYQASFDVNVLASLFNSSKIGQDSYFKQVLVVDLGAEESQVLGFLLDEDKYIYKDRINTTTSFFDPSNLITTTRLFNFVKTGVNPHVNGVKLVNALTPAE